MRLLMGTSIVTVKTMVAAQRMAANAMKQSGATGYGTVLEGRAKDEHERQAVPERHRFAERACQRGAQLERERCRPAFAVGDERRPRRRTRYRP